MNIYPGLKVRHSLTEREYKVTDVSRHFLSPDLFVVFERTTGGIRASHCVSSSYFEKNFTPVETGFFTRSD